MKLLIILVLLAAVFCYESGPGFDRFDGWSREKLRNYFGVPIDRTPQVHDAPRGTIFDGRTAWPTCAWDIQDQGQCGSCWSFGLSESAADRWCIAHGSKIELSPQDAVSCDSNDYGCQGGYMDRSNNYLRDTGIVTRACFPYVSGGGSVPACLKQCKDGSTYKKYRSTGYRHVTGVSAIETAIQQGPCDIAFSVYEDFFSYKSGVYFWDGKSPYEGGHAVKMVGYGHDAASDLDYWIIANSWGTGWGSIGGYFWIKKGTNDCAIEANVFCMTM